MALMTTAEAARRLGVTHRRVRQLIEAGRLPASKFGPVWVVVEADLRLVENRPGPGRPPRRVDGAG